MSRSLLLAALALLGAGGLAPPAAAQEAYAGGTLSARDSARLLSAARGEQARFERIRRDHLPQTWGGGSGECDERIGRFCLTHGKRRPGEANEEYVAPPEEPEVTEARDRMLDLFAEGALRLPGDAWLAGQRVRYLVEARRMDEAREVAEGCRAEREWCEALRGFALHHAGDALGAEAAFDEALRRMPEEERAEWTDLRHILDERSARLYRRMEPAQREAFEARFWRLADPLFLRPGNELRAEHLARNVWDRLQDRARTTDGISWGSDLRQIVVRYGIPVGWERLRDSGFLLSAAVSLVSHYSGTDRDLLPPFELLGGEPDVTGGVWDAERAEPRTGYAIPLADSTARWIAPFGHQVAVFRRGESAVIVAAYDVPADSLPTDARLDAALVVLPEVEAEPRVIRFPEPGLAAVLSAPVEPRPVLLSLEVLAEAQRRIARQRYGLSLAPLPEGLLGLSDLLLLRPSEALPDSLPDAVSLARTSTRVRPGEQVGVYWEVYGLGPGQHSLSMSLRLLGGEPGLLRRLAERVGVVAAAPPVRLEWREQAVPSDHVARSATLQIPEVAPGEYTVELSLTAPGREAIVVRRLVTVEGPPE